MIVHKPFAETFRFRLSEWVVAVILSVWGALVLLNPAMFNSMPTFAGMLELMPQVWWGGLALTVGLVGFSALVANGAWRPSPLVRLACCVLRCLFWIIITFGLARGGLATTGYAPYTTFIILEIINAYHAAQDAGGVFKKH